MHGKPADHLPGLAGGEELVSQMLALPGTRTDPQTSTSTEYNSSVRNTWRSTAYFHRSGGLFGRRRDNFALRLSGRRHPRSRIPVQNRIHVSKNGDIRTQSLGRRRSGLEGAGHPGLYYPRAHLAVNAMCLSAGGLGVLAAVSMPGPATTETIQDEDSRSAEYRPRISCSDDDSCAE